MTFPYFPGYPGPALMGRRAGVAPVVPPVIGGVSGGGAPGGPLPNNAGLPDHLLRFMENARAGRLVPPPAGGGEFLPPEIPGMPKMPAPPPGFMGGAPAGGLFQPLQPVNPFDQANQVSSYGQPQEQGPAHSG